MLLNNRVLTRRSILNDSGILNPTARIANLRSNGIIIECKWIKSTNKFGRSIRYGAWSLLNEEKALEIYETL
jgi:hypothetical protein